MKFYVVAEVRMYLGTYYIMPIDGSFNLLKMTRNPLYKGIVSYDNYKASGVDGDLCWVVLNFNNEEDIKYFKQIDFNNEVGNYFLENVSFLNLNNLVKYNSYDKALVTSYVSIDELKVVFNVEDKSKKSEIIDEDYIIDLFSDYDYNYLNALITNTEVYNYVQFLIHCFNKELEEVKSVDVEDTCQRLCIQMKKEMILKMKREAAKYRKKHILKLKK